MKKRLIVLILPLLCFHYVAVAQQSQIKGTVRSSSGEPVEGVSVVLKGQTSGTTTNAQGVYTLNIPSFPATLVFSFVNMKSREIEVNKAQEQLNVILESTLLDIDEVVVVGYGVQKKRLVTGATGQIKIGDLEKMNSMTVSGALQGQVPGVNVLQRSGEPGDQSRVIIRGIGTVGNATPLYIVDGFPDIGIDQIDPANIESIDILKDAASAAIYGSRAANGVVLITTKKGVEGKTSISYNGTYSMDNMRYKPQMLDAKQFIEVYSQSMGVPTDWFKFVSRYDDIMAGTYKGTDWIEESLNRNAPNQTHSLTISGGNKMSIYSRGFNYAKGEGMIGKPVVPVYERFSFRINSDHKLITNAAGRNILTAGENLSFNRWSRNGMNYGKPGVNNYLQMIEAPPILPVYDENGNYSLPYQEWMPNEGYNPLHRIKAENDGMENQNNSLIANTYIQLEPIKNMVWKTSMNFNYFTNRDRKWTPAYRYSGNHFSDLDYTEQGQSQRTSWVLENTLAYSTLIHRHKIDALAGMSVENNDGTISLSASNQGARFDDFEHAYIDNTIMDTKAYIDISGNPGIRSALASFFGRVNYNYAEKYLFTGNLRYDGSSKFMRGHRWGMFPSVSAGWVITEENFAKPLQSWINFFKIRASWGQNGNQQISDFQYLATVAFGNSGVRKDYYTFDPKKQTISTGAYFNKMPNPDITWETSEQTNIGFDARFLRGRLNVTFDYYNKETRDWLVDPPASDTKGYPNFSYINGGNVRNRGVEFAANWNDKAGSFKYGAGFNFAYNRNKVTQINNEEKVFHASGSPLGNSPDVYRAAVGYPIGYFWGYKTLGVFQSQEQIDP